MAETITNGLADWVARLFTGVPAADGAPPALAVVVEDAKKYLDIVVPTALRNLTTATRADYAVLKAASVKYS
jgi:hypothetical protein